MVDEEKLGKPQMMPKPKFLENLEAFLKKELRSLGVTKVEPNELRLQVVYQNCVLVLIRVSYLNQGYYALKLNIPIKAVSINYSYQ